MFRSTIRDEPGEQFRMADGRRRQRRLQDQRRQAGRHGPRLPRAGRRAKGCSRTGRRIRRSGSRSAGLKDVRFLVDEVIDENTIRIRGTAPAGAGGQRRTRSRSGGPVRWPAFGTSTWTWPSRRCWARSASSTKKQFGPVPSGRSPVRNLSGGGSASSYRARQLELEKKLRSLHRPNWPFTA